MKERFKRKNILRSYITIQDIWQIVLSVSILIIVLCLLVALTQHVRLTSPSFEGIPEVVELTKCNLQTFLSISPKSCELIYEEIDRHWLLVLLAILRILVIALVVSIIVVKLLSHKDLFEQRRTICLSPCNEKDIDSTSLSGNEFWEKEGGWELRCRLYNATKLTLLNLNFNAKLRHPRLYDADWSLKNETLTLGAKNWSIALPYVPLTIRVPLLKADVEFNEQSPQQISLKKIQSNDFVPIVKNSNHEPKSFIVINVEGRIVNSDQSMVESLWWPIADKEETLSYGKELPVNVVPGSEPMKTGELPKKWTGWEDFQEGVMVDNYIFGYGSLMDEWLNIDYHIVNLMGFVRDWHATMDNTKCITGYKKYSVAEGDKKINHVSFLNITKQNNKDCFVTGLIKKVTLGEIVEMDKRERNYLRIDVTQEIEVLSNNSTLGKPFKVWTYTASQAARARGKIDQPKQAPKDYFVKYEEAVVKLKSIIGSSKKQVNFEVSGEANKINLNRTSNL